jgi:hypothetical protein
MGISKIQIPITLLRLTTVTSYLVYIYSSPQGVLTYMHAPPLWGEAYSKLQPKKFNYMMENKNEFLSDITLFETQLKFSCLRENSQLCERVEAELEGWVSDIKEAK